MCSFVFRWTQPQRDMRGLHRLLHDAQQPFTQHLQVYLLAQSCTEGCHDLGTVILATVEAAVNEPLNASLQRPEQGVNGQCGGHDDEGQLRDGS